MKIDILPNIIIVKILNEFVKSDFNIDNKLARLEIVSKNWRENILPKLTLPFTPKIYINSIGHDPNEVVDILGNLKLIHESDQLIHKYKNLTFSGNLKCYYKSLDSIESYCVSDFITKSEKDTETQSVLSIYRQLLLPMKNLTTLTLSRISNFHLFSTIDQEFTEWFQKLKRVTLILNNGTDFEGIISLLKITNLKSLSLVSLDGVNSNPLQLSQLKSLESLHLSSISISNSELNEIITNLPKLNDLSLFFSVNLGDDMEIHDIITLLAPNETLETITLCYPVNRMNNNKFTNLVNFLNQNKSCKLLSISYGNIIPNEYYHCTPNCQTSIQNKTINKLIINDESLYMSLVKLWREFPLSAFTVNRITDLPINPINITRLTITDQGKDGFILLDTTVNMFAPKLQYLKCTTNDKKIVKTIESSCKILEEFEIFSNSLDILRKILKMNHPTLKSYIHNGLSEFQLSKIKSELSKNRNLTNLQIRFANTSHFSLPSYCTTLFLILETTRLKSLSIENIQFSSVEPNIKRLIEQFRFFLSRKSNCFIKLNLFGNSIIAQQINKILINYDIQT
ncbi:leucine-rich repeat-containing protein (LRR) [Tieghemostelium lacteum]|uniref:Leucine-rich repeat-containing protein (LRR) n=1 Tax=Tieghemostelium lacteum TaxID=361077 RepID=A0A151Z5J8_TIELA|nr:leucine-rich repeat-containing protein (LRR) [Tieghemostelium lacteum]|eukprot:KYQ89218.1 leucine-rich repeat-containing protein (LRR) [Tieghemostelium lacteum]